MNVLVYTQTPACNNLDYSIEFTWDTGITDYIVEDDSDSGVLKVFSILPSSADTSNMAVSAVVTVTNNNGNANE